MLLVALVPQAASWAAVYATSGTPQKVEGYGSFGRTHGEWDAKRVGSDFESRTWRAKYRYVDADDHTIYVRLNSWAGVLPSKEAQSSHDNKISSAWTDFRWGALHKVSRSGLSKANVEVRTCLDVPWRTDPCSAKKSLSKQT